MTDPVRTPANSRAALLLWPIALLTAIFWVRESYVAGDGSDLYPVWQAVKAFLHGGAPYGVEAFVYPPSALLLFAPLGFFGFTGARIIFHVINAACITGSAVLLLRHFRVRWLSPVAPAVMFAVFVSFPVHSTLGLGNVNGPVLLAEAAAFVLLARRKDFAAGAVFGLGLAVKPILAPLLLIFLLDRRFRAAATAVAVPILLSVVAIPLTHDVTGFVHDVVPFLARGNYSSNYLINTSLRGSVRILELPAALGTALRVVALAAGVTGIAIRRRIGGDERIVLAELSGIALATTFLVFPFSWPYYCLFLMPVFVSFADEDSMINGWRLALAGAALYGVASPDLHPRLQSVRVTGGLIALLLSLASVRTTRDGRAKVQSNTR
jgi:arabinofuranan 3-O-arabinosyltransferase